MSRYLLVAIRTALCQELDHVVKRLKDEDGDAELALLVPTLHLGLEPFWEASEDQRCAQAAALEASRRLRRLEVSVAPVEIGNGDPFHEIIAELQRCRTYDAVLICRKGSVHRLLRHLDLASRIRRRFPEQKIIEQRFNATHGW